VPCETSFKARRIEISLLTYSATCGLGKENKKSVVWTVCTVQALRSTGTRSRCSRYGKLLTVNLVWVAYVLTVINTIYFSTWLHKYKVSLTKFWNSDRNHNALWEMFSSLQQSLGRHQTTLFDLTCWISSGLTVCVRDCPCFTQPYSHQTNWTVHNAFSMITATMLWWHLKPLQ